MNHAAIGRGSKPALFGAEFAPFCALMGKRAEKPGENRQKREGKWPKMAVFRGAQTAISPCSEATALDRNPAVCQTLRLWSPAASSGHRTRELAVGGHFSRTWARTDRPVRAMTDGRTVGFTHPTLAHSARCRIAPQTAPLTGRLGHRRVMGPSVVPHNQAGGTRGAQPQHTFQ